MMLSEYKIHESSVFDINFSARSSTDVPHHSVLRQHEINSNLHSSKRDYLKHYIRGLVRQETYLDVIDVAVY